MRQVTLFRLGTPAGFVTHAVPGLLRQQLLIASGPLLVNTAAGLVALTVAWRLMTPPHAWWSWPATVVLVWLGLSVLLEAWPSAGDARALCRVAAMQARGANPGVVLALPLAWALLGLNWTRQVRGHWLYAGALAWLARGLALG